MAQSVVALFDTFAQAEAAVVDLIDLGVPREKISLVAGDTRDEYGADRDAGDGATGDAAAAGAVGGTLAGGAFGLLVGLAALAIPGVGPVLAAGAFGAAITAAGITAAGAGIGAAAGSVLGALTSGGLEAGQADAYAEGLRRGGAIVNVDEDGVDAHVVRTTLNRHGVIKLDTLHDSWQDSGWQSVNADEDLRTKHGHVGQQLNATTGAATGAAVGSVAGPIGAAIGGVAGAAIGAGVNRREQDTTPAGQTDEAPEGTRQQPTDERAAPVAPVAPVTPLTQVERDYRGPLDEPLNPADQVEHDVRDDRVFPGSVDEAPEVTRQRALGEQEGRVPGRPAEAPDADAEREAETLAVEPDNVADIELQRRRRDPAP